MERRTDRCWAEVRLSALKKNIKTLGKAAAPARLMAVVKADGYGHGMLEVAALLRDAGVEDFAVATLEEGLTLRSAGFVSQQILLLGSFFPGEISAMLDAGILPTVSDMGHLEALQEEGRRRGRIRCHLKVDTGMHRFGFPADLLIRDAERVFSHDAVQIDGIYSHLASSPRADDEATLAQIRDFRKVCDFLELNNIWFGKKHLLNSGGIINYREACFDLVRPGLALYGYYPGGARGGLELAPAMTLKARVIGIREAAAGAAIGYDRTYRASGPMQVALLPIGYADGYGTGFSNRGQVWIGKKACPVVGRVCMDTTLVDVTGLRVRPGDVAVLWGAGGQAVEDAAALVSSISYELCCQVSRRVPRVYVS